jgi:hypothetical protein
MIEQGDLRASISHSWDHDAFDLMIWRAAREEGGSYQILFGTDGLMEQRFVSAGEAVDRPSLRLSATMAPVFFRLMGQAADQLGVLPDVVAAQVARLEAENKLLREMLERADRAGLEHRGDLRLLADTLARR